MYPYSWMSTVFSIRLETSSFAPRYAFIQPGMSPTIAPAVMAAIIGTMIPNPGASGNPRLTAVAASAPM